MALVPEDAKKLLKLGFDVFIEENAGLKSGYFNGDYTRNGAKVLPKNEFYEKVDILIKINTPADEEVKQYNNVKFLIAKINVKTNKNLFNELLKLKQLSAVDCDLIPKSNLTKNFNFKLSEQELIGYRASIECLNNFQRVDKSSTSKVN